MLCQLGEGLSPGPVDANNINVCHVKLHYLKVRLPKNGDYTSDPCFDVGGKTFTTTLTCEMSSISFQLILLLLLFTFFQPGLENEEDVTLQQYGIRSDVLHVLAKGAGVEGAHFHLWRFLDANGLLWFLDGWMWFLDG